MSAQAPTSSYSRRFETVPAPALLITAIISFQIGAACATHLFPHTGVEGAVFLRSALGAVLLLAIARPRLRGRSRHDLLLVVALGALLAAMNSAFYQAIDRLPLGVAVTVEFLGPLTVAVIASRRRTDVLWVLLAAAGVALFAGAPAGHVTALGLGFALLAATAWAGYILVAKRVGDRWSTVDGIALSLAVATVLLAPPGAVEGISGLDSLTVWALALGVAVFSTAFPYTLEIAALRRMPARVYGVLTCTEPVAAAAVGVIVLGQSLTWWEGLAACLVVIASIGATRESTEQPEIAPN